MKSNSSTVALKQAPQSLRRSKTKLKFSAHRDDLNLKGLTARVFATSSPLLSGRRSDVGVYGAPCGVLIGYTTVRNDDQLASVQAASGTLGFITGRIVEVTLEELAALDQVAEHSGGDYHRFLTDITLPNTGYVVRDVWVYQLREHATVLELNASAVAIAA